MRKTGAINLTIIFIITVTHTTIKTASTDIMAQDVISATKIMSVLMTNHTIIMGKKYAVSNLLTLIILFGETSTDQLVGPPTDKIK